MLTRVQMTALSLLRNWHCRIKAGHTRGGRRREEKPSWGKLIGVVHPGYFGRDPRSGKRRDRHDRGRDSEPFLKAGKRPKGGEGTWFGVAARPNRSRTWYQKNRDVFILKLGQGKEVARFNVAKGTMFRNEICTYLVETQKTHSGTDAMTTCNGGDDS